MKKIAKSLMIIGVVALVAFGASQAFFSDTEESTDNILRAGAIDLRVDNTSYYNGELSSETSWELTDLSDELFFNFTDLKPGDWGEDTISLHVDFNDAYACMDVTLVANDDFGNTEPELDVDEPDDTNTRWDGELAQALNFVWWADDGDNVLEATEAETSIIYQGSLYDMVDEETRTGRVLLADTSDNVWGERYLPGDTVRYVAKAWCHGALALDPVADDEGVNPTVASGITCDGSNEGNITQTDHVQLNLGFYAVQSRNNDEFVCNEAEAEVELTRTWSAVDLDGNREWFAKAKVQEPNPASDFELQIGTGDSNSADFDQDDTVWTDGQQESFTLTYDGVGNAMLEVAGRPTVTFAVGADTLGRIGITVKAPADATTLVDNLALNVAGLPSNSISATNGATNSLTISGVDLSSGFVLTGNLTFDWDTLTSNGENQKVQFSID